MDRVSTSVVAVDPQRPDPGAIEAAAAALRRGGLVAFPTETVYGLGADGLAPAAVERIYAAKGRPPARPLTLHILDIGQAEPLVAGLPRSARRLAERFWPGPLTLVLPRGPSVPAIVSAGGSTVGLRAPDHAVARALIAAAGVPIAAPSANRSGRPSPTTAQHVLADLRGRVDIVLDAGPTGLGIDSTVLDLTATPPRILRLGGVSSAVLREELGEVAEAVEASGPAAAGRRYAPSAALILVRGAPADQIGHMLALRRELSGAGRRPALLALAEEAPRLEAAGAGPVFVLAGRHDPGVAAARLFGLLREFDAAGYDPVLVQDVPGGDDWEAVADRLRQSASEVRDAGPPAPRPLRLLFVCSGNTCRSPMAAALARHRAAAAGAPAPAVEVASAGVAASAGEPASAHAVAALAERGIDLGGHRSRPLDAGVATWADLILTMTAGHRRAVERAFPEATGRVFTLHEFTGAMPAADVPDPIGGALDDYRRCAGDLAAAVARVFERLARDPDIAVRRREV